MTSGPTSHNYLNQIIEMAINEGVVSKNEIENLIELYGTNHRLIVVDILSFVYQRKQDQKQLLVKLQEIYRRGNE